MSAARIEADQGLVAGKRFEWSPLEVMRLALLLLALPVCLLVPVVVPGAPRALMVALLIDKVVLLLVGMIGVSGTVANLRDVSEAVARHRHGYLIAAAALAVQVLVMWLAMMAGYRVGFGPAAIPLFAVAHVFALTTGVLYARVQVELISGAYRWAFVRRVVRLPGSRLRALLTLFLPRKTVELVVEPVIADMQQEYVRAEVVGDRLAALSARTRGYLTLAANLGVWKVLLGNVSAVWILLQAVPWMKMLVTALATRLRAR